MSEQLISLLSDIPLERLSVGQQINIDSFIDENGKVPDDYLILLDNYHGGSGLIGEVYISLWEPKEISSLNADYEVQEFAPGFTIFGSNGGGTAYAFERSTGFIYHFAFIGMTVDDPAIFISKSFEEFLNKVKLDLLEY